MRNPRIRIWVFKCVETGIGCIKKSKIQKCSELNSERPIPRSKSAPNDPGTLIIGFALKNYAQKWSEIIKTLDGCSQNDDFGIFVRSLRTLVRMSIFLPVLGSFHPQFDNMLRATSHIAKHKVAMSGRLLSRHKMRGSQMIQTPPGLGKQTTRDHYRG